MRFFIISLLSMFIFVGCDKTDQATSDGATESTNLFKKVKEFTGWEKSEEEKQADIENVKIADEIVSVWTAKLEKELDDNEAFIKYEGVTEVDPWGQFIAVEYSKEGSEETMVVASAGPDESFGTNDDITRTRKTTNQADYAFIIYLVGGIVVVWVLIGLYNVYYRSTVKNKRRSHSRNTDDGIGYYAADFFLYTGDMLFSPFFFIGNLFDGFGGGGGGGFDGGFDIDLGDFGDFG